MGRKPKKPYVIPVFIPHSGCGHRCTFCNQKAVTGAEEQIPGPESLRNTAGHWLQYRGKGRGFTEISFYGGNFLGLDKDLVQRLLAEASGWVSAGKIDGIRFSTRPDTINRQNLGILADHPVTTVELGVQSMDDRVLKRVKRGHFSADSSTAAELLKNSGYTVGCQIMTGLPEEDENSAICSAEAVASLKPDFVRIYPLVVLSGSALAGQYRAGKFEPLSLEKCVSRTAALYRIFRKNSIPVVRMGLQSCRELDSGTSVLAGPYHPALGHLVLSRIMLERAFRVLDREKKLPQKVEMRVNPVAVSRMRGLKNANMSQLYQRYPGVRRFSVRPDPDIEEDEVVVAA